MNRKLTKTKIKVLIYLGFGGLFVVLGWILLNLSNSIDPIPEFKEYEFRMNTDPIDKIINQYMLFYDFKENKGNISFSISSKDLEYLGIYVPVGINYNKIFLMDRKKTSVYCR